MKTEMKTEMKINEESLREVLAAEIRNALDFEWTGWRIPIFLEEDGTCSGGTWISSNSWQPDAHELPIRVETWNMGDLGYDEYDDSDVDAEVDRIIDSIINELCFIINELYEDPYTPAGLKYILV